METSSLVERFNDRQRGALARLVTYIENEHPLADEVLEQVQQRTGSARIIGVTGPPGAGKSTLTNALIKGLRAREETVAVLAVDPSSSMTGGATLGDRIRMIETYNDDGVYIRSMATRGQYGGLNMSIGRATLALEAFGFDVVILETVGVGQDEVDIASAADTTLLLQVPGLGDSVQTIKAGILEIADIIVVNKAEMPEARTLQRDLRAMLRFRGHLDWLPPIVPTVSTTGEGVPDLLQAIDDHANYLAASGEGVKRLRRRIGDEVRRMVRRDIEINIDEVLRSDAGDRLLNSVQDRELSPRGAARRIMTLLESRG